MTTHSRTYLMLLALQGNPGRIVDVVRSAKAAGLAVLIVTDRRSTGRVRAALVESGLEGGLELRGLRSVALSSARGGLRRVLGALARRAGNLLYRGTRFFRHRLDLPPSLDRMMEVNGRWARSLPQVTKDLIDHRVDPVLDSLAGMGTAARQTVVSARALNDLIRLHRVLGVVCLDGRSLLPGWVIARRFRGLPVLTNYPMDWTADTVRQLETLATGTRW